MACGCAAVVSRAGSLPELIEEGVSGFAVRPGDPGTLRSWIAELLDNPTRWAGVSRAATLRVQSEFTWARVAKRCMESYVSK
jgi:glycosyltransferase involved in cell wall biosynthesis